jgi:CelD/BcsL family acetyltransferase involved in cellulose biosynthesis
MTVEHVAHRALSGPMRNAWLEAAEADPLMSPFLMPGFADAALSSGLFPFVTTWRGEGGQRGFLATAPVSRGIARPLAGAIADVHGICGSPGLPDDEALLRALGAGAFLAHNWQQPSGSEEGATAFLMSIGAGYAKWRTEQIRTHSRFFRKLDQRHRKAQRECGSIRLELREHDDAAFEAMKQWKRDQYRAAGKLDVFAIAWVDNLLSALKRPWGGMRPVMASLYLGDQLAAVEFGLRHGALYHSWFPAYNPQLRPYGPGHLLLHAMISRLSDDGVTRIDLGVGAEHYKEPFANDSMMRGPLTMIRPGWAAARVSIGRGLVRALPKGPLRHAATKLHGRWAFTAGFAPTLKERYELMGQAISFRLRANSSLPIDERYTS